MHTSPLPRDSSEFDCPALCDLPVAGQSNVHHLLFLVLGIFVLGLTAGRTLTFCACVRRDYARELRHTVIHRGDHASGTEARQHRRTRRTFWKLSWTTGYRRLRLAVTCEDDPECLHERLMLWVIKPHGFVVLTPDGDMHDEM